MENRPIKIKIDVTKIDRDQLYPGKKGQKYLSMVLWANKDGVGQYGDTHYVTQDISKEARETGCRGAILGNATVPVVEASQGGAAPYRPAAKSQEVKKPNLELDDSDIPF